MHGYEIYQRLTAQQGLWPIWRLKQSQLYALLARLEEQGYLAADLQPQAVRPPRKIYSLTAAGRTAFLDWLHSPVARGRQMRIEFLARFYFACRQGQPVADNLLAQQTVICEQWLAELRRLAPAPGEPEIFVHAVHQFRVRQVQSFLAWLADCRAMLAQETTPEGGTNV